MKKNPIRLILILFFMVLIVASGYVAYQLGQLDQTQASADALFQQRQYSEAIDAYAKLLQKTPATILGRGKEYPAKGAEGVLASMDALLETVEGAQVLMENGSFDNVSALAAHPAVPASFQEELDSRAARCTAILERFQQEQAEKAAAEAEAQRRKLLLNEAMQARIEGRLEDALKLAKESGLQEELITDIEKQIVQEKDDHLAIQARAALEELMPEKAAAIADQVTEPSVRDDLHRELKALWARKVALLQERYGNCLHAGAWYSLIQGQEPRLTGDKRYEGLEAGLTSGDTVIGGWFSWIKISDGKVELVGDTLGAVKVASEITDAVDGALGLNHGLILHKDGTVTNLGARQYGRGAVAEWTDITAVAAGGFHSLGLTNRGTVVAAGLDLDGQCRVTEWTDVVAVAAGLRHSVALLQDGCVLAVGDNSFGQCDVSDWEGVVAIRCGGNFTLGLTIDGRLLATGDNGCGQCDVSAWKDVVAFDGGLWHTLALLGDGRIVSAGANGHGQCDLQGTRIFDTDREDQWPAAFAENESEFVYVGDPLNGPWLYYNGEGSVVIAFDADTGKIKATRADLICTYGHPPVGILSGGGDRPWNSTRATILARQNRAVFALTGDYFTFDYNADGLQIRRGIVFKQEKNELGFGFFPDGSMQIIDPNKVTAEDLLSMGVRDSWVFGPTLILDGQALDIHKHPLSFNDVTMRSVMASICPYHHIGAAYGSSTLAQVVDNLLDYGCEIAYNLDGGRSSMLVFMGKAINRSSFLNGGWRGLQDMVGFLTSEQVPKP